MSERWNMKTFMKGASILTISALLVKILSAVYRVPYQNLVGDKGFYIYQQVYPFIGIFIIWTSYGFAVAVSKLLASSETDGQRKSILRVAFLYLFLLSVVFFILLTGFAPFIAQAMGDPQLVALVRVSAYIVWVMPFLAVLKGSFQSTGTMIPVAVSNVGEQGVRVLVVLIGTWIAVSSGASLYRAGEIAMWGAVAGELAGVLILAFYFRGILRGKREKIEVWSTVKELTIVSISVSASSLILLLFQLVDSFTILNHLVASGMNEQVAMAVKGVYDRGQPLVQMGILIATTLALAIVPLIAYHAAREKGQGAVLFIRLTYRTAFLFGLAASVGLILVLPFVNEMLFETSDGSLTLMIFSGQILWLSLLLPLIAILQGAGRNKIPTLLLIVGFLMKWLGNKILIPIYGTAGAAIASNIGFIIALILLFFYFKKVWPIQMAPARFYGWLFVATMSMVAVVLSWEWLSESFLFTFNHQRLNATLIALTSVTLGAMSFLLVVLKTRIMNEKEWYLLPFGKRLANMQVRLNKGKGE